MVVGTDQLPVPVDVEPSHLIEVHHADPGRVRAVRPARLPVGGVAAQPQVLREPRYRAGVAVDGLQRHVRRRHEVESAVADRLQLAVVADEHQRHAEGHEVGVDARADHRRLVHDDAVGVELRDQLERDPAVPVLDRAVDQRVDGGRRRQALAPEHVRGLAGVGADRVPRQSADQLGDHGGLPCSGEAPQGLHLLARPHYGVYGALLLVAEYDVGELCYRHGHSFLRNSRRPSCSSRSARSTRSTDESMSSAHLWYPTSWCAASTTGSSGST